MVATVLVVDDESAQRELLRRWLDSWGYSVRVAADARQGLEAMLAEPADILLADIRMPVPDGLWLAERIRAQWPRTSIVIVSGVAEAELAQKAGQLGKVDYVTKPFSRELLRQALDRAELRRADQRSTP